MKKLLIALLLIGVVYAASLPVQSYLLIKGAGKASVTALDVISTGTQVDQYIDLLSENSKTKSSREEHVEFYKSMSGVLVDRKDVADPQCRLGYDKQAANRVTALCRMSFVGAKGALVIGMSLERIRSSGEWKVNNILAKLD